MNYSGATTSAGRFCTVARATREFLAAGRSRFDKAFACYIS